MLTAERLRELLDYDPETGVFRWRVDRRKVRPDGIAGSIHSVYGYRIIKVDFVKYRAARLAWLYVHGRWPLAEIDHRNRRRDDDRIANLREATHSQNGANQTARRTSICGVRGVSPIKKTGRFMARAGNRYLGTYSTIKEAATAYQRAARKTYGEFAVVE